MHEHLTGEQSYKERWIPSSQIFLVSLYRSSEWLGSPSSSTGHFAYRGVHVLSCWYAFPRNRWLRLSRQSDRVSKQRVSHLCIADGSSALQWVVDPSTHVLKRTIRELSQVERTVRGLFRTNDMQWNVKMIYEEAILRRRGLLLRPLSLIRLQRTDVSRAHYVGDLTRCAFWFESLRAENDNYEIVSWSQLP